MVARLWELVRDEFWAARAKWSWGGFENSDKASSVEFKLGGQDVLLWKSEDDRNLALLCRLGETRPIERTFSGAKWVAANAIVSDDRLVKWASLSDDRLSLWNQDFQIVASAVHGRGRVQALRWRPANDGRLTFFIRTELQLFTVAFNSGRFEADVHANLREDLLLPETDRLSFVVSGKREMRWNDALARFEEGETTTAWCFNDDFILDWETPILYAHRGGSDKSLHLGFYARSFVADQLDTGVVWGLSWWGKKAVRFRFLREIPTLLDLAVDAYAKACFDGLGDPNLKARFATAVDSNRRTQHFPLTQLHPVSLQRPQTSNTRRGRP